MSSLGRVRWLGPQVGSYPIVRTLLVVLALLVLVIVSVAVAFAVDWEFLREDGVEVGVLAASALGLGLLAARWTVMVAAVVPALAFLAAELRPTQDRGTLIAIDAGGVALLAALCLLVGVAAGKLLGRVGRTERTARTGSTMRTERPARGAGRGAAVAAGLGGLLVTATAGAVAFAAYREYRLVDEQPGRPLRVDEDKASFRGVAVGDSVRRAREVLGPGRRGSGGSEPLGVDASKVSTPISMPDSAALRYRDVVVYLARGRVAGFTTTASDAETKAGVGVGDSLRVSERVYRRLECDTATHTGDEITPAYPYCAARLGEGRYLWFGGNPIDNITVLDDRELARSFPPLKRESRGR